MKVRCTNLILSLVLVIGVTAFHPGVLMAEDKPLFSDEIRTVLESQGVAAAKTRFAELYPSQKERFNVDTEGLANLGTTYMQSGEMEKGMAVLEMVSVVALGMAASVSPQAMQSAPQMADFARQQEEARVEYEKQQREVEKEDQKVQDRAAQQRHGKSRDDLDRFTGVYGVPGGADSNRTIWVMVSCDGFLVSGASWGGAGQWWMRSAADKVFTYQDSFQSLSMEFLENDEGKIERLKHDLGAISSPLEWQKPVPDDWGTCLERPKR